ncbi:hypothetical protein B0F90DRAFT_1851430 [Multifurca ochricompacta]|uniref:Uncharacterized protein n=1 Tax=Multifurca ochricompacta TaxID=376703 RepID=A0AAD4QSI1_9AGAM|nr:hypothetical protein B0F90DRAFT_1851430 [Multifurca ochricompacta]
MASFSRLQLAAALIEYDNDPSDPAKTFRSAHESAIFAHLRRIPALPPQPRKSIDYLSVDLPGDSASSPIAESAQGHVRAPSSTDMLRNPFGRDTIISDGILEEGEGEMEVDLASWGLDSFIPKEKASGSKNTKGKEKVAALPNPHASTQAASYRSVRSLSMGNLDSFGVGGAFLDSVSTVAPEMRRRSLGSALELGDHQPFPSPLRQRPSSTHDAIDRIAPTPPLHSVPFPLLSTRSASPGPADGLTGPSRERATSSASMGSRGLLAEAEQKPNPFAIEPPSGGQASRFDPKVHARTMSLASMGSVGSRNVLVEEVVHTSSRPLSPPLHFDSTALGNTRGLSNASVLREIDAASLMSGAPVRRQPIRDRPYSTVELMRPKVLVMPSPLQGQSAVVPTEKPIGREGFEITTDGPPLPHGARSSSNRRLSSGELLGNPSGSAVPIASNSFTPNPRASLTLSQLTFRNTLMVGGQRDVSYVDIDAGLRRATEEGEQIVDGTREEEPARPVTVVVDEPESFGRPAGKLYGRSLVDELELRKATMRSKQRVFTGDDRPSMMARGSLQRSSTLIDPASLNQRPVSQNMLTRSERRPNLDRRGSFGGKPLLNFDDDRSPGLQRLPSGGRAARSVFGVDTLWEREMAKLKEIEAKEAEEQRRQEADEVGRLQKKPNKKRKGKEKTASQDFPVEKRGASVEAPVLPIIPRVITNGVPPPPNNEDTESDSESSGVDEPRPPAPRISTEGWHSDEEGDGPVRTTGVGPRYPKRGRGHIPAAQQVAQPVDDMIMMMMTMMMIVKRTYPWPPQSFVLLNEKPLSQLVAKSKIPIVDTNRTLSIPDSVIPAKVVDEDEDEDDTPLGLRVSRFIPSQSQMGNVDPEDDDDRPLAFHPEQQRRTQYNMFLQQQQQQQLILQAQMQQSMMFSPPSMMGSGFFSAPVLPQMMPLVPPAPANPSPGAPEMTKFGRVDRWRREIVGGQP